MDSTMRAADVIEVTGGSVWVLSKETGQPVGPAVPIGVDPCIVGRGEHCQLVVADPLVSESHCSLAATPKGVRLADLGSKNGTYLHPGMVSDRGFVYVQANCRFRAGDSWLELSVSREQVPISSSGSFGPLVGRSEGMRAIYKQLEAIAPTDLSVLITGETGTGKELVARAVHDASKRSKGPFLVIDCSTIPASLAESVLFGHEKGAFTGAVSSQVSPFVSAKGGTIFLDEIGELPPEIQPKLLRALQAREIKSVGSNTPRKIDVRVVAATLRDLHVEVNEGRFRADLFHRFNQVEVRIPPLRERSEDVADLVAKFLAELGDPSAVTRLHEDARERLKRYEWPGNVRELRNVIEVALALSHGGPIEIPELGARGTRPAGTESPLRPSLKRPYELQRQEHIESFDRVYLTALLRETQDNLSEAARVAGVDRQTLRERMERAGLRRPSK